MRYNWLILLSPLLAFCNPHPDPHDNATICDGNWRPFVSGEVVRSCVHHRIRGGWHNSSLPLGCLSPVGLIPLGVSKQLNGGTWGCYPGWKSDAELSSPCYIRSEENFYVVEEYALMNYRDFLDLICYPYEDVQIAGCRIEGAPLGYIPLNDEAIIGNTKWYCTGEDEGRTARLTRGPLASTHIGAAERIGYVYDDGSKKPLWSCWAGETKKDDRGQGGYLMKCVRLFSRNKRKLSPKYVKVWEPIACISPEKDIIPIGGRKRRSNKVYACVQGRPDGPISRINLRIEDTWERYGPTFTIPTRRKPRDPSFEIWNITSMVHNGEECSKGTEMFDCSGIHDISLCYSFDGKRIVLECILRGICIVHEEPRFRRSFRRRQMTFEETMELIHCPSFGCGSPQRSSNLQYLTMIEFCSHNPPTILTVGCVIKNSGKLIPAGESAEIEGQRWYCNREEGRISAQLNTYPSRRWNRKSRA